MTTVIVALLTSVTLSWGQQSSVPAAVNTGGISAVPSSLKFPKTIVGPDFSAISYRTIELKNTTEFPIAIVSVGGLNVRPAGNCVKILAPSGTCALPIAFSPGLVSGPIAGHLSIETFDGGSNNGELTVPISGVGVKVPKDKLTMVPSQLDFGQVYLNVPSTPQTVTIVNDTAEAVSLDRTKLSNFPVTPTFPFGDSDVCSTLIASHGTCQFTVTFAPDAREVGPGVRERGKIEMWFMTVGNPARKTEILTLHLTGEAVAVPSGPFLPVGQMGTPRVAHTATLLPSGKVLIAGGYSARDNPTTELSTAELYDPVTGLFASTFGSMNFPRAGHTATVLPDGKVFITGGVGQSYPANPAEIYDPATETFSTTGTPAVGTYDGTATLTANGQVLVAGGQTAETIGPTGDAEVYNPTTGTFGQSVFMHARFDHTATLLSNGKVLIAGGDDFFDGCCGTLSSAEIFDPDTSSFESPISMVLARESHTATSLGNGQILIAGGFFSFNGSSGLQAISEFYDPTSNSFTAGSSYQSGILEFARSRHTATLLSGGRVLVAGGDDDNGPVGLAEFYDPSGRIQQFPFAGNMLTARANHTATALNNGLVLLTGGFGSDGSVLSSAELYVPIPQN